MIGILRSEWSGNTKGGNTMVWIAVGLISVLGGLIQTVTGFGAVVTLMLVLPYFFPIVDASTLALTINMALCVALCWQYRAHLDLRAALAPTAVFSLVHLLVLQVVDQVDTGRLEVVFAVFLIVLSLYYLLAAKKVQVAPKSIIGIVCGAFSGTTSAFFAIGGPPMAIYFLAKAKSYFSYVACMQFLFVVTTGVSLVGRAVGGLYQRSFLHFAVLGTVGMLLGMQIGKRICDRLNAERMRQIAYLFVGISGVMFLVQSLG